MTTNTHAGGSQDGLPAPDPFWHDLGLKSRSAFHAAMPRLVYRSNVPESVQYRFEMLGRLITACYYDHKLLDMATEYALVTLELALRARYLELVDVPKPRIMLGGLIQWAIKENLLDDPLLVDNFRELRNETLHASESQRFGIVVPDLINRVSDLCNSFYEDRDLRVERLRREREISLLFEAVSVRGAVLDLEGTRVDVVLARVLHVEMTANPPVYHFLFWPLFDPLPRGDVVDEGNPILVACTESTVSDAKCLIGPAASLELKEESDPLHVQWNQRLKQSAFPVRAIIDVIVGKHRNEIRRACL